MKKNPAFTLIELLAVILIIGIVAGAATVSFKVIREKSRDSKRLSDIAQIQNALEFYHRDESQYPLGVTSGQALIGSTTNITYLTTVPNAPLTPDGNCTSSTYSYQQINSNDYTLEFCLGHEANGLAAGPNCAGPKGIIAGSCSSCNSVSYGGELYPAVQIGSQCWLAKNLNIGTMVNNGNSEPNCHDTYLPNNWWACQIDSGTLEKYCYNNDTSSECNTYGGLYEWSEAMGLPYDCNNATATDTGGGTYSLDCPLSGAQTINSNHRGICPMGWHIPTFTEIQTLAQNTDPGCDLNCDSGACSCSSAGDKLKATSWGSTDDYSFTALPSGTRDIGGTFTGINTMFFLWSSTPHLSYPYYSWLSVLVGGNNTVLGIGNVRAMGYSVRCIKN